MEKEDLSPNVILNFHKAIIEREINEYNEIINDYLKEIDNLKDEIINNEYNINRQIDTIKHNIIHTNNQLYKYKYLMDILDNEKEKI